MAATVLYLDFADGIRSAIAEREFAERAVVEARAKRQLSLEQIAQLLAQEEES